MKPKPIKDVIKGVIKTWSGESGRFNQDQILKVWRKVVGRTLAKHSKPASFRSSRLIVNVDSSGYLYELTIKRAQILRKLKKKFKKKPLEELQFRIGEL